MGAQTARPKSKSASVKKGLTSKSGEQSPVSKTVDRKPAKKEDFKDRPKVKLDADKTQKSNPDQKKVKPGDPAQKKKPAESETKKSARPSANVHFNKEDKQRATTVVGHVTVLEKSERPSKSLWWLAGGRTRERRGVPTAGELRDRKKVETANREAVGFLGTILGVRAVKKVHKKPAQAEPKDRKGQDQKVDGKEVVRKTDGESSGQKKASDAEVKKGKKQN